MAASYSHNPNLYQWKRFTRRREETKEVKNTKKNVFDDEWVKKKLETAAEKAMKVAFYDEAIDHNKHHLEIYDPQDEYSDAHKLISEWVSDKIHEEFLEDPKIDITSSSHDLHVPVHSYSGVGYYSNTDDFLDHCLKVTSGQDVAEETNKIEDKLNSLDLYGMDEKKAASLVVQNLMEKPIINTSDVKKAVPKKPKSYNPVTKMEMRHKAVKESAKKRRDLQQQKQEEKLQLQEAKLKAKQLVKEEERKKLLQAKQEENAIKREMIRLRKEFANKREQDLSLPKEKENQQETNSVSSFTQRSTSTDKNNKKSLLTPRSQILASVDKEQQDIKINHFKIKHRRKVLHQHFMSWYKLVLSRRLKLGKAKAVADWRLLLKSWSIWRKYVQDKKLEQEAQQHTIDVRNMQKNEKVATKSNKLRILRKYFIHWKLWTKSEIEKKDIATQQQITKSKMQALIEKVVNKKLETENHLVIESIGSSDEETNIHLRMSDKKVVNQLFNQNTPRNKAVVKRKTDTRPKEAWQVRKDHVYKMSENEFRDRHSPSSHDNYGHQRRNLETSKFDPFQNRHKFQKDMLEEQKHLIQEQKRMIEDLKEERRLLALNEEIKTVTKLQTHDTKPQRNYYDTSKNICIRSKPTTDDEGSNISNNLKPMSKKTAHPLVTAMEERAKERSRRHEEIKERRRQKEQEKIEELQRQELEKQRQEEEKIKFLKEEKRKEIELRRKSEEEKRQFQQRMKMLHHKAKCHYEKYLLTRYGMRPWKRLIASLKAKVEVGVYHYENNLVKSVFNDWRLETVRANRERNEISECGYKNILLKRVIRHWKIYGEHMSILEEKATLHYNKVLKVKSIKLWAQFTTNEKLKQWDNESLAKTHNIMRMKKRVFIIISTFAKNAKQLKQRDERISMLRQKVTRLLPDYQPDLSTSYIDEEDEDDKSYGYT